MVAFGVRVSITVRFGINIGVRRTAATERRICTHVSWTKHKQPTDLWAQPCLCSTRKYYERTRWAGTFFLSERSSSKASTGCKAVNSERATTTTRCTSRKANETACRDELVLRNTVIVFWCQGTTCYTPGTYRVTITSKYTLFEVIVAINSDVIIYQA